MTVVVTGATGHLGRLVVEALLDRGVPAADITATGRSLDKLADLAARGVTVAVADYTDAASLDAAFAGADTLLLVSSNDFNDRAGQHRNADRRRGPRRHRPRRLHLGPEGHDLVDDPHVGPQGDRGAHRRVRDHLDDPAQRLVRRELHRSGRRPTSSTAWSAPPATAR